jgi:hypothetical protein
MLSDGRLIGGAALATSEDVAALRFGAAARHGDVFHETAVLLGQPGDHVFGHQLLDLVPRVITARRILPPTVPFLVGAEALSSFHRMLDDLGLADAILLPLPGEVEEMCRVGELFVVVGARQDARLDPERFAELQERAWQWSGGQADAGEHLFLSRSLLPLQQLANRPLVNRAEVEDAFEAAGFVRLFPEQLPLRAAVRRVKGAATLAGEDGSALHNVLWGPQRLLCLGHPGFQHNLHLQLCDALGIPYLYFGGETETVPGEESWYQRNRSWSVQPTSIRRALDTAPVSATRDGRTALNASDIGTRSEPSLHRESWSPPAELVGEVQQVLPDGERCLLLYGSLASNRESLERGWADVGVVADTYDLDPPFRLHELSQLVRQSAPLAVIDHSRRSVTHWSRLLLRLMADLPPAATVFVQIPEADSSSVEGHDLVAAVALAVAAKGRDAEDASGPRPSSHEGLALLAEVLASMTANLAVVEPWVVLVTADL